MKKVNGKLKVKKSKKEYVLDDDGNKVLNKNGKPKTRKIELTDWNDKGNAERWRESYANMCNQFLEKAGEEKRVDHRSFKRQGIEEVPTIHLGASVCALEKKGIQTDKGNINREIKIHNSLVKEIRKRIAELTLWINDFAKALLERYEQYKQTRQDEIDNKAELFNLYEYISIYSEIQGEKSQRLPYYAKMKKESIDLNRFVKATYYLKENKLTTISDLQGKITDLQSQNSRVNKEIKAKTSRVEELSKCFAYINIIKENKNVYDEWNNKKLFKECFAYINIIKENKNVYDEWNNKKLFKDRFYNSHKQEIEKYRRAKGMVEKITGSSVIKVNEWQEEIRVLENAIGKLNDKSESIKKEYENINHIKYAVKTVNDDYGIDLSIEIDKAIKRGEKPSVIAQLKKYKEQQDKYERKKDKVIKHYKSVERG